MKDQLIYDEQRSEEVVPEQRSMSQEVDIPKAIGEDNGNFYEQQLPDARMHQRISFIKSGIRLLGYVLLPFDIVAATIFLFISEVVGILEELV